MPYDGIGAKLMIHKVTDFAKETSNLQKSGEVAQSHIQQRAAADAARAHEQVQDIYEPSEAEIRREQERKKRQDQGRDKPADRPRKQEEKPGAHIDIEI